MPVATLSDHGISASANVSKLSILARKEDVNGELGEIQFKNFFFIFYLFRGNSLVKILV